VSNNQTDEQALIDASSNGDREAFGELVRRYERLVYHTLKIKIHNREDALDLSQEVFLKCWRALPNWRGDCKFSTWLYRICINTGLDFLRRQDMAYVESTSEEDEDGEVSEIADTSPQSSPEKTLEQTETARSIRKAIDSLPAEQREVILLRDMEGYSYEQIAEMLSVEIGTVKSRLNRARGRLRETLGRNF